MGPQRLIAFLLKVDYTENIKIDNVKEVLCGKECRYIGIYKNKNKNKLHVYVQFKDEPIRMDKIISDFKHFGEIDIVGFCIIEDKDELIEECGKLIYLGPKIKVTLVREANNVNNFTIDIDNIHERYITKEFLDMLQTIPEVITKNVLKDLELKRRKRCNRCNGIQEDESKK